MLQTNSANLNHPSNFSTGSSFVKKRPLLRVADAIGDRYDRREPV